MALQCLCVAFREPLSHTNTYSSLWANALCLGLYVNNRTFLHTLPPEGEKTQIRRKRRNRTNEETVCYTAVSGVR